MSRHVDRLDHREPEVPLQIAGAGTARRTHRSPRRCGAARCIRSPRCSRRRASWIASIGSYSPVKVVPRIATTPIVFSSISVHDLFGRDHVPAGHHRHVPRLDIPVPAELLPHDLDVGAEHEVGPIASAPIAVPARAPPPLHRQAREHDRLARPDRRRAHAVAVAGALNRSLTMLTHRRSISAVCGYSSLSIMFLSNDSAMSRSASGSIHVVTNVARFSRELPSSSSSSWISLYAASGRGRPRASRTWGSARDRAAGCRQARLRSIALRTRHVCGPSPSLPTGPNR